jgi:hypothetical protein
MRSRYPGLAPGLKRLARLEADLRRLEDVLYSHGGECGLMEDHRLRLEALEAVLGPQLEERLRTFLEDNGVASG